MRNGKIIQIIGTGCKTSRLIILFRKGTAGNSTVLNQASLFPSLSGTTEKRQVQDDRSTDEMQRNNNFGAVIDDENFSSSATKAKLGRYSVDVIYGSYYFFNRWREGRQRSEHISHEKRQVGGIIFPERRSRHLVPIEHY